MTIITTIYLLISKNVQKKVGIRCIAIGYSQKYSLRLHFFDRLQKITKKFGVYFFVVKLSG